MIKVSVGDLVDQHLARLRRIAREKFGDRISDAEYDAQVNQCVTRLRRLVVDGEVGVSMGAD